MVLGETKDYKALYDEIYNQGRLFGVDRKLAADPLREVPACVRPNSVAFGGGAFGDEGKGRIVDETCQLLVRQRGEVIVYRWNGGANAGHTVVVEGNRLVLHQLPSGVLFENATTILGKGMVIHPGDLIAEIDQVVALAGALPATLYIDAAAVLSLDTHRGLEGVLKRWAAGGRGATGRGISPAYADVLHRHPVRVRDLMASDWEAQLGRHYDLYHAMVGGLDGDLPSAQVVRLEGGPVEVGDKAVFLERLAAGRDKLGRFVKDVHGFILDKWQNTGVPFVFEGAQGFGLDPRFGVYPDVTASDPTFGGILHSTEGAVQPAQIAVRAATLKATYTSSVGTRRLPTEMDEALAHRIREDAHEYGATTRRPRDIAHIDIPCLHFLSEASGSTHLVLTHLDIAYTDVPVKVCTHYTDASGSAASYRPDQVYLDSVTPHYIELPMWDGKAVEGASAIERLPQEAYQYIAFLSQALGRPPLFGTTGPQRDAVITWLP
jgi:adenylosuccinate synthase